MLHFFVYVSREDFDEIAVCTVSSESSLVTYAPYCLNESRESSGQTALEAGHLCSIFVYVSREDFDEIAPLHSLI